jgi:heterodisulfide reductase subunit A2
MKAGVYFCACGSSVSDKVRFETVAAELGKIPQVGYVRSVEFLCSEEGKQFLEKDLIENRPDRVVIAACSPREIGSTFMQCMQNAGLNPYFLQIANIREQVAWVTPDPEQATPKACAAIRAAVARVCLHEPLERKELDVCRDVLVVGAGPAGLKAALSLAEAGRHVVLLEKTPVLGGMPVRYEELFPNMECGPCLLEPVMGEVLHGEYAHQIEILTMSELVDVKGYYGNLTVTVKPANPKCFSPRWAVFRVLAARPFGRSRSKRLLAGNLYRPIGLRACSPNTARRIRIATRQPALTWLQDSKAQPRERPVPVS